jgi:hypothetical protein
MILNWNMKVKSRNKEWIIKVLSTKKRKGQMKPINKNMATERNINTTKQLLKGNSGTKVRL